jgi:hypothetical protein
LAIASIPVLLNPLPPMADYVNHLARMQIIATINSDPVLHRHHEIDDRLAGDPEPDDEPHRAAVRAGDERLSWLGNHRRTGRQLVSQNDQFMVSII